VQCSGNLSTEDLETELFLHILQNCQEYVDGQPQGASDAAAGRAAAAAGGVEGDGVGG
jgi:hypothetical protein